MPAIGVHHTATENSKWDGPAAVAAMPAAYATLHYCHACWSDDAANKSGSHDGSAEGDGDPDDKKSNYKFPHHRKTGGAANIPGCRNGLARLSSANIPSGDDAGVKSHLQAHINDWNKAKGNTMFQTDIWNRAVALGNMTVEQRLRANAPRVSTMSDKPMGFAIRNAENGSTRVDIDGEIGWSLWGDGLSAKDVQTQLNNISTPNIALHINSPGGDVFDGIAILNSLRSHPASVSVTVDGLAASAASFIAMAGDSVAMMPNSQMMIHDASGVVRGNASDMGAMATLLDKISDNIADVYARRAGGEVADWRTTMQAETWYNADEAVDAGLADHVVDLSEQHDAPATEQTGHRWNFSFYNYDGRHAAPAPKPVVVAQAIPEFDSAAFLTALRGSGVK